VPLRVLIADDSPIMRRAIRNLLASEPEIEIVGEATSFREMCELRAKYNPEIVVMDMHIGGITGDHSGRLEVFVRASLENLGDLGAKSR
jgi:DNA-binding NarL/FixJ family response regulator